MSYENTCFALQWPPELTCRLFSYFLSMHSLKTKLLTEIFVWIQFKEIKSPTRTLTRRYALIRARAHTHLNNCIIRCRPGKKQFESKLMSIRKLCSKRNWSVQTPIYPVLLPNTQLIYWVFVECIKVLLGIQGAVRRKTLCYILTYFQGIDKNPTTLKIITKSKWWK